MAPLVEAHLSRSNDMLALPPWTEQQLIHYDPRCLRACAPAHLETRVGCVEQGRLVGWHPGGHLMEMSYPDSDVYSKGPVFREHARHVTRRGTPILERGEMPPGAAAGGDPPALYLEGSYARVGHRCPRR